MGHVPKGQGSAGAASQKGSAGVAIFVASFQPTGQRFAGASCDTYHLPYQHHSPCPSIALKNPYQSPWQVPLIEQLLHGEWRVAHPPGCPQCHLILCSHVGSEPPTPVHPQQSWPVTADSWVEGPVQGHTCMGCSWASQPATPDASLANLCTHRCPTQ